MRYCAVCRKNYFAGDGPVFRVPQNESVRNKWIQNCGVNLTPSSRVCGDHFAPSSIVKVGSRSHLLPHAEPCLEQLEQDESPNSNFENCRFIDMESSFLGRPIYAILQRDIPTKAKQHKNKQTQTEYKHKEEETQTDTSTFEIPGKEDLEKLKALEAENEKLKRQLVQANEAVNEMRKLFSGECTGLYEHVEWLERI